MIKIIVYSNAADFIDFHYVNDVADLNGIYDETTVVFSEIEFTHPIIVDGTIREMTSDETKLHGVVPLDAGEKIINNVVVVTEKPDRVHSWNGEEWIFDTSLFDAEKNIKYDALRVARDKAFDDGFMLDDKYLVKSRVQDMTDANAVFNQFMAGVIVTSDWHHSNGVIETIDKDRFLVIYQAMGAYRSAQFKKEGTLRAAVANATTIAELDGIVWY